MDRRCIKCYARLRGTNIRIQHRTDKPVYRIDSQEIRFENHCPPERLPERFAEGVEEGVYYFASEHGIQGIQVELLDGGWHESDSHKRDFMFAAMLALFKVFPQKNEVQEEK